MPYIPMKSREIVDPKLNELIDVINNSFSEDEIEGVCNYVTSKLLCKVFKRSGWRYVKINRIVGVLNCVLYEFYRRIGGPYEDSAIVKNGDIFDEIFPEGKVCCSQKSLDFEINDKHQNSQKECCNHGNNII